MPDKRRHRGKHPQDDTLFSPARLSGLRSAADDLALLLTRGYAEKSALKLVGDRYDLTARQRTAVWRSACSDQALQRRRSTRVATDRLCGARLGVDGYNLLITVESALSGGLVLIGCDGCCRDLASIHGTYRKVEETEPALRLIFDCLAELAPARIDWYLDRPVSNSGRLKTLIADLLERMADTHDPWPSTIWNIELVNNPDATLSQYDGIIASSDSLVLDNSGQWSNLSAHIIAACIPGAWIVDLSVTAAAR